MAAPRSCPPRIGPWCRTGTSNVGRRTALRLCLIVECHVRQQPELSDLAVPQMIEVDHLRGDALACRAGRGEDEPDGPLVLGGHDVLYVEHRIGVARMIRDGAVNHV